MNESIVVYQSRYQQDVDLFFYNNPEYIIYIAWIALFVFLGVYVTGKTRLKNLRNSKRSKY